MNEQELQKAFAQYLVKLSGAKSEKELETYVQKLGKDGLQKAYQQFLEEMKKPKMARHGAKLNYIKRLQNLQCAEDEELTYFKIGGKFCRKCQKKAVQQETPEKIQHGTKVIKEFKQAIEYAKCGGKKKKKAEEGMKVEPSSKGARLLNLLNKSK